MQKDQSLALRFEEDIIRSRAVNKHKRRTPQSIRDHHYLQRRIKDVGIKMDLVSEYLCKMFGDHVTALYLLAIAMSISEKIETRVDRLARRNKSALMCWYAENWGKIYPFFISKIDQNLSDFVASGLITKYEAPPIDYIDVSDLNQLLNSH